WMRGEIIPVHDASIGVTDWGVIHSDITYDVAAVWEGGFFRLDAHLDRFEASMAALRLEIGMDRDAMETALTEMVAASGLRHAYCAMVASRGSSLIPGSRDPRDCANHFYGWCVPFIHVFTPEIAARGSRLKIASTKRIPPDSVDPRVKNYHWGDFTAGLFEAKDAGFDSTLLLDHAGNVTEGPGFNIFAVFGDRLVTPETHCLEGITRQTMIDLAAEMDLATEIRALPFDEFTQADEVFTATTGGGPAPVVEVDGRIFSNGAPGATSRALIEAYHARRLDPAFRTEISYQS
ncbi:MAG: aminotransferase class IV, partial [Pseudomonadota bacterium]